MIDAVTGAHLWADRFERDLTDVFALQDEVMVAVVSTIQPKLLQTEIRLATRRRPESLTAYDLFLRAMQHYYTSTREGLAETIRLAHCALELDPRFGFVAALAGVCHMQNVLWGYAVDPQFERKEAVRFLQQALSIDDGDPDTTALVAMTSAYMVGDGESEIEMADRAVALNPNSFRAWSCRGQVYRIAGLPEEAVQSFEHATRMSPIDPLLFRSLTGKGLAFIELGRFDEAIVAGKKAQRQNPSYATAYEKYGLDLTTGSSSWWVSDEDLCPALRGRQQFLLRKGQRVKEGLHRGLAEAPAALMRARFVVRRQPGIEVGLQLVDRPIDLLAERHPIELVEHGAMEALADAVGLRALGLGAGVIDVLDREIELVFVARGCRKTRCRDRSAPGTAGCRARRRTAPPGR